MGVNGLHRGRIRPIRGAPALVIAVRIDTGGARRYAGARLFEGELMTAMSTSAIRAHPAGAAAFLVAAGGAATILGAYFFQYVLGVAPCPLCLDQRMAYYVAIPLAIVVGFATWRGAPRPLVLGGFALLLVVLLIGAAIAIYHSGVEWKLWEGPRDCSGPLADFGSAGGGLLSQMQTTSIVRCDVATRYFGISLANANVIISLALAAVALSGIRTLVRG